MTTHFTKPRIKLVGTRPGSPFHAAYPPFQWWKCWVPGNARYPTGTGLSPQLAYLNFAYWLNEWRRKII